MTTAHSVPHTGTSNTLGRAVALMLLPTALAIGLLLLGVATTTMAFVYLSIAASLVAAPAFVLGIVMLVRRRDS